MTPTEPANPDLELEAPCLGVGRTSRVWRGVLRSAFDGLPAGTAVAVKILREELAADAEAVAALGYEREASRSVHHPALVRSRHLSEGAPAPPARVGHAVDDAGASRPWLVLDLVPGASLDELLVPGSAGSSEPLPEPLVRRIGARIAGALAAMHAAGWVHGDVKPENVRLQADGTAVLLDLGFARRAGAPDGPVGTPLYVAPERTGGGAPVATADLFALGCLLFELGVGAPPARTPAELEALRAGRAPTPSESLPRLSPLFDAIVRALLRTSPAARPTARQVSEALEEGESSAWWRARLDFDPAARRDTVAWAGTHDLPLVGRDAPLAALARAWDGAGRDGGSAVLLEGERGSGKSRLVAEFVHRVRSSADPALYLYGRCNAIGDERPAAPLVKLLRRWLHLPSGTTAGPRGRALLFDTVRDDVAETLLAALHPTEAVEAAAVSESVALGDWLLALGRLGPTIVFLDDVQYAGEATIAALRRVARDLGSTRLLFVLGEQRDRAGPVRARVAEVLERAADRTTRIELGALDEAAVLELVESTFDASVPRLRLARALYERSGGSPGRIKEVLRLARDRGHIRSGSGGGVQLLVDPLDLPSPESVRVLAEERLDELGGPERIWLERAAVVGSRIDLDLVSAAWPRASAARRDAAFGALVRSNWLVPVGAQFRFALPRDRGEVLRTMRPRAHVRAHGAIACALQARETAAGRRPSYRLAFHLREAAAHRALLDVLPDLIDRMRDSGHPQRRATLAGWGLEAMDELGVAERDVRLRRALLEALADAADRLGEREEQRAALEALVELEPDLSDAPHLAARVYVLHARHAVSGGRFGLARGFLRNAVELAARAEAGRGELLAEDRAQLADDCAEAQRLLAKTEVERGAFDEARTHAERAAALAAGPVGSALAERSAAEVALHQGLLREALARLAAARRALVDAPRGLPERAARAGVELLRGRAWRLVGHTHRAIRGLERAADLALESGEGRVEVEATARLGRLLGDAREPRRAELLLRDALFQARRIEDRRGEALAALFLGVLLAEENARGAPELVSRARRVARELGLERIEALALAIEARLAVLRGDLDPALRHAADGWSLVERRGAELPDRLVIGGTLSLVRSLRGEIGAAESLESALRARVEDENGLLGAEALRRRHGRWTAALLASALSAEGALYPRVLLQSS